MIDWKVAKVPRRGQNSNRVRIIWQKRESCLPVERDRAHDRSGVVQTVPQAAIAVESGMDAWITPREQVHVEKVGVSIHDLLSLRVSRDP